MYISYGSVACRYIATQLLLGMSNFDNLDEGVLSSCRKTSEVLVLSLHSPNRMHERSPGLSSSRVTNAQGKPRIHVLTSMRLYI